MRLRSEDTLRFLRPPSPPLLIPLHVDLEGRAFALRESESNREEATASVEGPVGLAGLRLEHGPEPIGGGERGRYVSVPERADGRALLTRLIDVISFLVDVPVLRSTSSDVLVPESQEDRALLESMGTTSVYRPIVAVPSVRTFAAPQMTEHHLRFLFDRQAGLSLYAQAILTHDEVARFRELWKILESAFGAKGDRLVGCLAQFEPAQEMEFTRAELSGLFHLRGRASHADCGADSSEIARVRTEVGGTLPRLKCLVEQVLWTKKTWGCRGLGVERMAALRAYLGPGGAINYFV